LLRVVEVPSGKDVAHFEDLHGVADVVFRSEDELIILHGKECWLCGVTRKRRRVLWQGDQTKPGGYVSKGALSPDGKTLAVGVGGAVLLLDVARSRVRSRLPAPLGGYVRAVAYSADGRYLAADSSRWDYSYFSFVVVWDVRQEKQVRLLKIDANDLATLAFRPDNQRLAVGGWDCAILIFDMEEPRLRRGEMEDMSERTLLYGVGWTEPVAVHEEAPHTAGFGAGTRSLQFSPNGRILKVVSFSGDTVRVSSPSGRVLNHTRPPDGQKVLSATVSNHELAAGVVTESNAILLWDVPRWSDA
jgi:WD40 repeat protein